MTLVTFQDMDNSETIFESIFSDEVVEVRCRKCGNATIMNKQYARYVPLGTIKDCGKCRNNQP